jgi:hypothetical protein
MMGARLMLGARPVGYCIALDGTNEYVDHGTASALNFANNAEFSVSFWVYVTGSTGWAITRNTGSSGSAGVGWLAAGHTGSCSFLMSGASGFLQVTFTGLTANRWNHVVLIKSTSLAASGVTCWVNGVDISASRTTVSDTLAGSTSSSEGLRVGVRGTLGAYFSGRLMQLAVYDKALSSGEVAAIYSRGLPSLTSAGATGNLAFYAPIKSGDSTSSIDDASSNNYDGTPQNMESGDFIRVRQYELIAA